MDGSVVFPPPQNIERKEERGNGSIDSTGENIFPEAGKAKTEQLSQACMFWTYKLFHHPILLNISSHFFCIHFFSTNPTLIHYFLASLNVGIQNYSNTTEFLPSKFGSKVSYLFSKNILTMIHNIFWHWAATVTKYLWICSISKSLPTYSNI